METKAKHTPLPWNCGHTASWRYIYTSKGEKIAEVKSFENDATYIVEACNNYEKALEKLKSYALWFHEDQCIGEFEKCDKEECANYRKFVVELKVNP